MRLKNAAAQYRLSLLQMLEQKQGLSSGSVPLLHKKIFASALK